jgi:hypothetical protein
MSVLIIGITLMLQSCNRGTADKNESASKNPFEMIVSENDFLSVPDSVKPWVYYCPKYSLMIYQEDMKNKTSISYDPLWNI